MAARVHSRRAQSRHLVSLRSAVTLSPQLVRLRPAPHCRTPILSYSQRVTPSHHFINWQQDPQSNYLARLTFPDPVREFRIEVDLVAEMAVYNPFDFFLEPHAETFPFCVRGLAAPRAAAVSTDRPRHTALRRVPRRRITRDTDPDHRLSGRAESAAAAATSATSSAWSLASRRRSRRWSSRVGRAATATWLLVQLLRHLGLAARFVSGYLIQLDARRQGARRSRRAPSADFTDLHAWCEVYLPGGGLDRPRSDLGTARRRRTHSALVHAGARQRRADHRRASTSARSSSTTRCRCARIYESPRVTKPYTDDQWNAIVALGHEIDRELQQTRRPADDGRRADVRVGRRIATARSGTRRRSVRPSACSPPICSGVCADATARTGSSTSARASGTRASSCLDGRSAATGAAMASPSWHDATLFADEHAPAGHGSADAERFIRALTTRLRVTRRARAARLRRRLVLPLARAPAAGQRRSLRCTARRRDGARAAAARLLARTRRHRWLCVAAREEHRQARAALANRTVVPARRAHVSDRRATRRWAIVCRSIRCRGRLRSIARLRRTAGPDRPAAGACAVTPRCAATPATAPSTVPQAMPGAPTTPTARRVGARTRADGAVRRGAETAFSTSSCRRSRRPTSIWSSWRRSRPPRQTSACRCCSKAIRRRTIHALRNLLITPDPGVIEVNIQPARVLDRSRRADDDALRGGAPGPA